MRAPEARDLAASGGDSMPNPNSSNPPRRGTKAAYARYRGVAKSTVHEAVRRGAIPIGPDGLIDFEAADKVWSPGLRVRPDAVLRVPAAGVTPEDVEAVWKTLEEAGYPVPEDRTLVTFRQARLAREILAGRAQRLRLAKQRGEFLDRRRAEAEAFAAARAARDALLAWPSRVSAELAAELGVDRYRLEVALRERMRALLAEVADRIGGRGGGER